MEKQNNNKTMKQSIYDRMAIRAAIPADVEETRTLEFMASDNTRDSYGTVLPVDKWDLDRFNKNGLVTYQHRVYSDDPDSVIGKAEARVEKKKLIVRITFESADLNPRAEKIFRKLLAGTLNGVSVSFSPTSRSVGHWGEGKESRDGENPTFYFDGQELLEVAVVTLPSNKNATRRSFETDIVRTIHDALDGKRTYSEIEAMTIGEAMRLMGVAPEEQQDDEEGESRDGDDDNTSAIEVARAMCNL
jgi:HK97 family phage prohead protease